MLTRHHGASDDVCDAWQAPKLFREIDVVYDQGPLLKHLSAKEKSEVRTHTPICHQAVHMNDQALDLTRSEQHDLNSTRHPQPPTHDHMETLQEHHLSRKQNTQPSAESKCSIAVDPLECRSAGEHSKPRRRPQSKPSSSAQLHWLLAALPQTDAETSSESGADSLNLGG